MRKIQNCKECKFHKYETTHGSDGKGNEEIHERIRCMWPGYSFSPRVTVDNSCPHYTEKPKDPQRTTDSRPEFSLAFQCADCGGPLKVKYRGLPGNWNFSLAVNPCETCEENRKVKFEPGKWYQVACPPADVGTEDFVVEFVSKHPDFKPVVTQCCVCGKDMLANEGMKMRCASCGQKVD